MYFIHAENFLLLTKSNFNTKSFLFEYIGFGLVSFYGISTIVGYLIPNPFNTYLLNIYDLVQFGLMAYQPFLVI